MAMPIEKLDELLEEQSHVQEGWRITDLKSAVWADERVRDAEVKLQEIDALTDERIAVLQAKIDKLNEWREEAKRPHVDTVAFFKEHLMAYLREQTEDGKTKSVKLPFRTLQRRAQQPEIKKDDKLLLEWAQENAEEFVEYKPVLRWGDWKLTLSEQTVDGQKVYVDPNGEIIPHIQLIDRPDNYDWKVKES